MLESMKKPGGPKKRKLGKAETVVAYQGKAPSSAPMSISKSDAQAHMGRMNQMFEDQKDQQEGEKEFGSNFKDLGLMREKVKVNGMPASQWRKKWDDEENAPYHERYERVSPTQDVVRVYRKKGKDHNWDLGFQKSNAPYGTNIKDENASDPRGKSGRAIVYERTIKDIAEEKRANEKARVKRIAEEGSAKARQMIAEEAAKAKAKAGGK
jgi:hypothetical protein